MIKRRRQKEISSPLKTVVVKVLPSYKRYFYIICLLEHGQIRKLLIRLGKGFTNHFYSCCVVKASYTLQSVEVSGLRRRRPFLTPSTKMTANLSSCSLQFYFKPSKCRVPARSCTGDCNCHAGDHSLAGAKCAERIPNLL